MKRLVTCEECGREFETDKPNAYYCSPACKEAGTSNKRQRWERNSLDHYREYQQERRAKQKNDKSSFNGDKPKTDYKPYKNDYNRNKGRNNATTGNKPPKKNYHKGKNEKKTAYK